METPDGGAAGTVARAAFRPRRPGVMRLRLRSRLRPWQGADCWREVEVVEGCPVSETAILICDMWDHHWCAGAERRVGEMVPRMNAVVAAARDNGVQIIHAPSDVTGFYADAPERRRMLAVPPCAPPVPLDLPDPPLPIDDSDGGCDTQDPVPAGVRWPWTRQHPGIEIAGDDVISDRGAEVYSLLRHLGIGTLAIMGVHTNMCVLHRTFAIKAMTRWGIRCILARDLTDAMYNPQRAPHVSHAEGTELVIQHIEKHWCPTVLGADLTRVEAV